MSPGERVSGIEDRQTREKSKSVSAYWRIALLLAVAIAVALPVSLSQAAEKVAGPQRILPCPDGSDAECVEVSLLADEGEFSLNYWRVSLGCIEIR